MVGKETDRLMNIEITININLLERLLINFYAIMIMVPKHFIQVYGQKRSFVEQLQVNNSTNNLHSKQIGIIISKSIIQKAKKNFISHSYNLFQGWGPQRHTIYLA